MFICKQIWQWHYTRDLSQVNLSEEGLKQDILNTWNIELTITAFTIFFLIFKALHLLMPFRMAGTMLITTWRMILADVAKWFSVYAFVLCAFSITSYVLIINYHVQEGIADMDADHNNGLNNQDFVQYIVIEV